MTGAEIFNGIATVLQAGAARSREWTYNQERQQQAEVFEAMAQMARVIAESVDE